MKLSILITALESRPWQTVRDFIRQQCGDDAEVLVEVDGGLLSSGRKRQRLMERAAGEYIAFVDDDDSVSADYVDSLLLGCRSGADVVTFRLRFTRTDRTAEEVWTFGRWINNRRQGRMCVNHLCAWRREIASKVAWCPDLGCYDDHLWFEPLFHAGLLGSEYHVRRVLYAYHFDPGGTVNQRAAATAAARRYFSAGIPCYRDAHREIFVGLPDGRVRDRHNRALHRTDSMSLYHTVKP